MTCTGLDGAAPPAAGRRIAAVAPAGGETGSTLVEVLVAALVAATGTLAMAQLFLIAGTGTVTARQDSVAAILAAQKLEELRAPASRSALGPAPAGSLASAVQGFVDHVGADGRVVATTPAAPPDAVYTRRWAVAPLSPPGEAVLVQVLAMPARPGADARSADAGQQPGAARLTTIVAGAGP
jgi:Tfp pilus assembly protein PilV